MMEDYYGNQHKYFKVPQNKQKRSKLQNYKKQGSNFYQTNNKNQIKKQNNYRNQQNGQTNVNSINSKFQHTQINSSRSKLTRTQSSRDKLYRAQHFKNEQKNILKLRQKYLNQQQNSKLKLQQSQKKEFDLNRQKMQKKTNLKTQNSKQKYYKHRNIIQISKKNLQNKNNQNKIVASPNLNFSSSQDQEYYAMNSYKQNDYTQTQNNNSQSYQTNHKNSFQTYKVEQSKSSDSNLAQIYKNRQKQNTPVNFTQHARQSDFNQLPNKNHNLNHTQSERESHFNQNKKNVRRLNQDQLTVTKSIGYKSSSLSLNKQINSNKLLTYYQCQAKKFYNYNDSGYLTDRQISCRDKLQNEARSKFFKNISENQPNILTKSVSQTKFKYLNKLKAELDRQLGRQTITYQVNRLPSKTRQNINKSKQQKSQYPSELPPSSSLYKNKFTVEYIPEVFNENILLKNQIQDSFHEREQKKTKNHEKTIKQLARSSLIKKNKLKKSLINQNQKQSNISHQASKTPNQSQVTQKNSLAKVSVNKQKYKLGISKIGGIHNQSNSNFGKQNTNNDAQKQGDLLEEISKYSKSQRKSDINLSENNDQSNVSLNKDERKSQNFQKKVTPQQVTDQQKLLLQSQSKVKSINQKSIKQKQADSYLSKKESQLIKIQSKINSTQTNPVKKEQSLKSDKSDLQSNSKSQIQNQYKLNKFSKENSNKMQNFKQFNDEKINEKKQLKKSSIIKKDNANQSFTPKVHSNQLQFNELLLTSNQNIPQYSPFSGKNQPQSSENQFLSKQIQIEKQKCKTQLSNKDNLEVKKDTQSQLQNNKKQSQDSKLKITIKNQNQIVQENEYLQIKKKKQNSIRINQSNMNKSYKSFSSFNNSNSEDSFNFLQKIHHLIDIQQEKHQLRKSKEEQIPLTEQFQQILSKVQSHIYFIRFILDVAASAYHIYPEKQSAWVYKSCFLSFKKYILQRKKISEALKGKKSCFKIAQYEIRQQDLKPYLQNEHIKTLSNDIDFCNKLTQDILQSYALFLKASYPNELDQTDINLRLFNDRNDLGVLLRQYNLQIQGLKDKNSQEQMDEQQQQMINERIFHLMETGFLCSQLAGKRIKEFQQQLGQQQTFQEYYLEYWEYFQHILKTFS